MKQITRKQLITALSESMLFKQQDLSQKSYEELLEHYKELYEGDDVLFPNGRDYDAEDEDGI